MSAEEVDFVLAAIADNWPGPEADLSDVPLERIDRDESTILEGSVRTHEADLQQSNYVGATLASRAASPIGTEYDHDLETVVGIRIEGLHHSQFGHVDPDGAEGVAWTALVHNIRDAILTERREPDAGRSGVSYTDLLVQDWSPDSASHGDYYREDFDVVFRGFEELP